MPELIGVVDGGFDQSFLQFNVHRKKYMQSSSRFEFKC